MPALLSILSYGAAAQWSTIASMGVGPTDGSFSFSLHGKGYAGSGSSGMHFYMYDTTTNTWTLKGNSPGNKLRAFGLGFTANDHGYACCGDSTGANDPTNDLRMYNDSTNTWTQKASFPGVGRDAQFCFVINDTVYVGGGFDGSGGGWNDFYKYNPFTDTWSSLAALPMGAIGFASSFVIGGKGYVCTGQVGTTESQGLWQYSPATNTWATKASLPGIGRQAGFGFALGNYGYVGGGMSGYSTVYNDVWKYNAATNTWSSIAAYPSAYPAWTTNFTIGNTAYIGTGTYFGTTVLYGTDSFKRFRGPVTTGVAETESGQGIVLAPNPASDYVHISGEGINDAAVSLVDMTGRIIRNYGEGIRDLYVGDMPCGLYVVRCVNTTGVFTERLIKR